jgi:superfamily II DNA/RNA helicase
MKIAFVFCNRKRDVATLYRSLLRHGFSVQALHGDMDQSARTAALEQFRKGEVTLLIASDVAARGLDIPDVSHVYNFDVPIHADDYVHRIGRTGRAGRSGAAISIVAGSNDAKAVAAIEKLIGQPIPWMDKVPGEPAPSHEEPRRTPRPSHNSPAHNSHGRPHDRSIGHRHQSHRPVAARTDDPRPRSEDTRPRSDDARPRSEDARPRSEDARPRSEDARPRSEDTRPRRAPQPARPHADESDSSHLPAFLLRPVPVKA